MKKTMIVAAMLPFTAFAQTEAKLKDFTLHFKKLVMVQNESTKKETHQSKITIPEGGDMHFGIDTGITPAQKFAKSKKRPDWDRAYCTAEHVTISCAPYPGLKVAYPDLKADNFIYDKETDMARLSGHVTIVDHGAEKVIANVIYLDLSNTQYQITGIN